MEFRVAPYWRQVHWDGNWSLGMRFVVDELGLRVIAMKLSPLAGESPSPSVTSSLLRSVHLGRLIEEERRRHVGRSRYLATHVVGSTDTSALYERMAGAFDEMAPRPGRPVTLTPEHFARVARVYSAAVASGKPTQAVARKWRVPETTAAKWVERCRSDELGLLPKTERGRMAGAVAQRGRRSK